MLWYRVPRALRVLLLATAWFSYGALLSNLNTLDDGSRTAEIIWGACLIGLAITALIDMMTPANRRRFWRSRLTVVLIPVFALPYLGFGALSADSSRSPYRVLLLWMFALLFIWIVVTTVRRETRIKQLESAMRHRQQADTPVVNPSRRVQDRWRSNAETPMPQRIVTMVMMSSTLAFVALLLADLDAVVYSDLRLSRLAWAALWASVTGVAATVVVFWDPRLRATNRTIEAVLEYDWAFRAGELPDQFDVDQWRSWMKSHHQSDAVTLIWAAFYLIVGCWSVLSHPSGYHWVLAILLAILAFWHVHRWRYLSGMHARLETLVERHTIRQLFG